MTKSTDKPKPVDETKRLRELVNTHPEELVHDPKARTALVAHYREMRAKWQEAETQKTKGKKHKPEEGTS